MKKTREEKRAEEARIIAEMNEAMQDLQAKNEAETDEKTDIEQTVKTAKIKTKKKQNPAPMTDELMPEKLHCKRCKTLMENGVCPTCGFKVYIPMETEKRNKIKLVVTAVAMVIFAVIFVAGNAGGIVAGTLGQRCRIQMRTEYRPFGTGARTDRNDIVRLMRKRISINEELEPMFPVPGKIIGSFFCHCRCPQCFQIRRTLDLCAGGTGRMISRIAEENRTSRPQTVQFFGDFVASPDITGSGKKFHDAEAVFDIHFSQIAQFFISEPQRNVCYFCAPGEKAGYRPRNRLAAIIQIPEKHGTEPPSGCGKRFLSCIGVTVTAEGLFNVIRRCRCSG